MVTDRLKSLNDKTAADLADINEKFYYFLESLKPINFDICNFESIEKEK